MKRLPVLQVLNESLDVVWARRTTLFVALVPVSLIYLMFSYVYQHLAWDGESHTPDILLSNLLMIFYAPIYTAFAVTVHRMVLIGDSSVPWYGQILFGYRELRFCIYVLLAWILYLLLWALIGNLLINVIPGFSLENAGLLFWFAMLTKILASYPFVRIALGFPAIAVDYYFGLKKTWQLSSGNSFRLLLAVIAVPMLFKSMMWFLPGASNVLMDAFYSFVMFVFFTVEIAILSSSYKWLVHANEARRKEMEQGSFGSDQD